MAIKTDEKKGSANQGVDSALTASSVLRDFGLVKCCYNNFRVFLQNSLLEIYLNKTLMSRDFLFQTDPLSHFGSQTALALAPRPFWVLRGVQNRVLGSNQL